MIKYICIELFQCLILVGFIFFGTKIVNYYYNFYHMYKFLDQKQKLGYFKNNHIVNIISKNIIIKKIIVEYVLIPIIKINYVFILLFITLLYSLCYFEFNNCFRDENILFCNHDKEQKKVYDILLEDSTNNQVVRLDKIDNCVLDNKDDNNNLPIEIDNIQNITKDYNQNISDIMNFLLNSSVIPNDLILNETIYGDKLTDNINDKFTDNIDNKLTDNIDDK